MAIILGTYAHGPLEIAKLLYRFGLFETLRSDIYWTAVL